MSFLAQCPPPLTAAAAEKEGEEAQEGRRKKKGLKNRQQIERRKEGWERRKKRSGLGWVGWRRGIRKEGEAMDPGGLFLPPPTHPSLAPFCVTKLGFWRKIFPMASNNVGKIKQWLGGLGPKKSWQA